MKINLFQTSVEELNNELAGTVWQVKDELLTVDHVFVNGYTGGYCVHFIDNSWGRIANLLEKATKIN
jgi:hypothetical protein